MESAKSVSLSIVLSKAIKQPYGYNVTFSPKSKCSNSLFVLFSSVSRHWLFMIACSLVFIKRLHATINCLRVRVFGYVTAPQGFYYA